MKTLVLTLTLLGAVIGLNVAGLAYSNYRSRNDAEGLEAQRRIAETTKARGELDTRAAALSYDGCSEQVTAVLALNTRTPIVKYSDIPSALAEDIVLCLKREIMSSHSRDRLIDSKLMQIFA